MNVLVVSILVKQMGLKKKSLKPEFNVCIYMAATM